MIFVVQGAAQHLLSFFIHRGCLPGFERQLAPQPNRAGKYDKHQQYGGKAHLERQQAEYADHGQEITPLQAVAPFAVFAPLFAADCKQADAGD